ncbi:HEAT repeat domain-containing protein [Singulisphaera sp. Ch08]|uniref:HEAT repeat domain-containing protein n=1 Tax=Singulisphaera sp. Ch08 TaxID=3120278 RepID=A0AAU7CGL3_9BACT
MSHPTERPQQPYDPALADLPPVEAPSAGFIVQLFVIPAVIVAVVIVVWLLFGKLAGGERDAMEYVRLLRSPNAHWRAAYELASLIQNDPKLANDPKLLGELTDLLAHDLDLEESPELTQYVTLTLGAFQTLDAQSADGRNVDPLATLARALAPKQPPQVRLAAAISLAKHAARLDEHLEDPGAIKALEVASEDENQELRQAAVYALGFFGGDQATRVLRDRLKDVDCYVRYNTAIALGRRGDSESQGVFREMLSSTDLNKIITLASPSEKHSKIEAIELEALQSLQHSVDRKSPGLAGSLRPEISTLTKSGLVSVRNSAQSLLKSLPNTP